MARPQDQVLVTAQGKPAPQYYDPQTGKFEYLHGSNGANYVEDRKLKATLDTIKTSIDNINTSVTEDDLIFIKKADAMPPVKNGMMVYVIDTAEVYVPYKGKWELLV